jgi:hypothetical protein
MCLPTFTEGKKSNYKKKHDKNAEQNSKTVFEEFFFANFNKSWMPPTWITPIPQPQTVEFGESQRLQSHLYIQIAIKGTKAKEIVAQILALDRIKKSRIWVRVQPR